MTILRREITIAATVAELRSIPGPEGQRYVWALSPGVLFRWVAGSNAMDDGFAVLVPNVGGFQGAWLRCRPSPTPSGLPVLLGDTPGAHINIGQGFWFEMPAATMTAPRTVTLDVTNASIGDEVEFSRFDVTANALTWANGGPGAGNIVVLPGSARSFVVAYFNGSDWTQRRSAPML